MVLKLSLSVEASGDGNVVPATDISTKRKKERLMRVETKKADFEKGQKDRKNFAITEMDDWWLSLLENVDS